MTDMELRTRCAERMGIATTTALDELDSITRLGNAIRLQMYDPLHNDAQAMALVKRFGLQIEAGDTCSLEDGGDWLVFQPRLGRDSIVDSGDLNRAIVTCVANLPVEPPIVGSKT